MIQSIEDYEDQLESDSLGNARKEVLANVSWEELEKKLDWDKIIIPIKFLLILS